MSAVVTWLGCDLVTGQIIDELPDLTPEGSISVLLGAYTSSAFRLPLGTGRAEPPRSWEAATQPGRAMIVAVLRDRPIWAGVVLTRSGGSEGTVTIACATLEAYLDRRFVGNHTWAGQDDAAVIAAGLIADAQTEGIGFTVDAVATGQLRDRTYRDYDDKSVYSALRELMGVINGPEWTVTVDWSDSTRTAIRKTVLVRARIGFPSDAPDTVFVTGSTSAVLGSASVSEAVYTLSEDYSAGRGANHVVATSSGEGETRPQSDPARDEAQISNGMPRWEFRFSPSTSITQKATLDAHARAVADLLGAGVSTLSISARADVYPILGTDWWIGDDIGYDLVSPRHPRGLTGVARAIGWELDANAGRVSPILLAPTV